MVNITNVDIEIEIDEELFNACTKKGYDVPKLCADFLTHYFDKPKTINGCIYDKRIIEACKKREELEKQAEENRLKKLRENRLNKANQI